MNDSNFFIAWNFARKIGDRPSRIDPLTRVLRLTAVLPGTLEQFLHEDIEREPPL